jgi:outer membrane biosynthesis protein TonB
MSLLPKDPLKKALYIIVPAAHILLFCGFALTGPPKKLFNSKKLVVKTFTTQSSPPSVKGAAEKNNPPAVSKKVPPKPEKKEAKKVQAPTLTPTPAPKKLPDPKKEKTLQVKKQKSAKEEVLKELEERIAKIEAKNDRMPLKPELAVPSSITLSSQTALQAPKAVADYDLRGDDEFIGSLISYLQGQLKLPDVGEVQIQLTLRKDGRVETMKVIKASSEKNRKYLEENLSGLSFPQVYLDKSSSRSFLFTFCNKF